ncbi:MAG: TonB-dependent receptor [Novacetimonas hansenii]|uniref:TonB-dependent receptor n=2 Tax=Novacetimonas hansenii TaxID=436 RepID=UPI0039EA93A0
MLMFANTGAAFLRYIPHRAGCAHIVFVLAVAVASTAQAADAGSTGKKKTAAAVHGTKPAPTAKNEYIHVNASRSMPDGVTLNAPGGGRMSVETEARSQTTLTRDYIAKQSPTANINTLIAMVPGVVLGAKDPMGIESDHMNMRGLDGSEVGYVFEGIPSSNPTTYVAHTQMLVDAENIGSIKVIQGSSSIDSPVYWAAGGEINTRMMDPSHQMHGYVSASGGSYGSNKEFARFETGDIGNTGLRGMASFSYTRSNNWFGGGGVYRYHVDSKLTKDWSIGNTSLIFGYTRENQASYPTVTMAKWDAWQKTGKSPGYNKDYYFGNTNWYKLHMEDENEIHVMLPSDLRLNDSLRLQVRPYYIHRTGPTLGSAMVPGSGGYMGSEQYGNLNLPYAQKGKATAVAYNNWQEDSGGLSSEISWVTRHNTLSFGDWYQYTDYSVLNDYGVVNDAGDTVGGYNPIRLPSGRVLATEDMSYIQQVNTLYIADTFRAFNDRLVINAAFKASMVGRSVTNDIPGTQYSNNRNYFEPLPQVSLTYFITRHDQVYVNGTTSYRMPASANAYIDSYSLTSPKPTTTIGNLKPEYDISEEVGYRHTGLFNVSLALFNMNLTNHQVSSSEYLPGDNYLTSVPLNVGGETIRGVQVEFGMKPWHHFSPYLSGQFLHATTDNNFNAGTDYLPTAGKTAIAAPKFSGSIGLQYDDGHYFGNANILYVDKQYSALMDNAAMPSYITANLTLGYRFHSFSRFRSPQIQINIMNVGDNHYLSAVSGYGGTAKAMKGMNGTAVSASTPSYFAGAPFAVVASVSTGF